MIILTQPMKFNTANVTIAYANPSKWQCGYYFGLVCRSCYIVEIVDMNYLMKLQIS